MTIKDELIEYCNRCLNDVFVSEYEDYISCKKHKNACRRLLNDFGRIGSEDFPYIWDETRAQNIVDWFFLLRHSKGILAGKPIELTLWQKFRLCQLYGWVHKDTGRRRFKKSFTEVARKCAKSQEQAGVALYEMSVTALKNGEVAEIYTAGTKREQSKIVFEEAKLMLKESPLRTKFKVARDYVRHIKTGSVMRPLSKEDGKSGDGTNPACLILDKIFVESKLGCIGEA